MASTGGQALSYTRHSPRQADDCGLSRVSHLDPEPPPPPPPPPPHPSGCLDLGGGGWGICDKDTAMYLCAIFAMSYL